MTEVLEQPCQHSEHERKHAVGPAVYAVTIQPRCCGMERLRLWCVDCTVRLIKADGIHCTNCGTHGVKNIVKWLARIS